MYVCYIVHNSFWSKTVLIYCVKEHSIGIEVNADKTKYEYYIMLYYNML
jgi:hypothetical protein